MPISMTQDNETYYLHYDQVGTLKAVTDKNQNIIKEITYDTFGNILKDTNPNFTIPFGFAGGLHDTDTNLVHFGYREYDPQTGKWTAKDPIDFSGGDSNLYGYVLGDPVGFVDPTGEFAIFLLPFVPEIGAAALAAGYLYFNPPPAYYDNMYCANSDYTGHGDNPEGSTGKKSGWNKHSNRRAGKQYGANTNNNRGSKNKKYQKPQNPNK